MNRVELFLHYLKALINLSWKQTQSILGVVHRAFQEAVTAPCADAKVRMKYDCKGGLNPCRDKAGLSGSEFTCLTLTWPTKKALIQI